MGISRRERPERIDARERLARAYDAHAPMLYRFALMILGNSAAAEDAVQQAFVKMMNLGDAITAVRSEQAYLRTAVRNECYRLLGARRDFAIDDVERESILQPVDSTLVHADELKSVEAALRALPPEQREVVHLKVYEEQTFQQIATLLGVTLNTAASRYRYAIMKLRTLLAEFQDEASDHAK